MSNTFTGGMSPDFFNRMLDSYFKGAAAPDEIRIPKAEYLTLREQARKAVEELPDAISGMEEAERNCGAWKRKAKAAEFDLALKESEMQKLRERIERAPVEMLRWDEYNEAVEIATNTKPDWSDLIPLIGKRVRLVVEEE